ISWDQEVAGPPGTVRRAVVLPLVSACTHVRIIFLQPGLDHEYRHAVYYLQAIVPGCPEQEPAALQDVITVEAVVVVRHQSLLDQARRAVEGRGDHRHRGWGKAQADHAGR